MASQYVFSHQEIEEFEKTSVELAGIDARLRTAKADFPFGWLSKTVVFAITLPEFDRVNNWSVILSEFEQWYHPIAIGTHANRVDEHLKEHTISDVVRFRGNGSMHHRFGVAFDSFALRLEQYGLALHGTNLQKSKGFWKALDEGRLTEEEAHSALREAMLPPSPDVILPQTIYGSYLTPAIRPCYIDFKKTLMACDGITDLLQLLFVSARMSTFFFDTSVDKDALNEKLGELIVLRGERYQATKNTPFSAFVAPSLYALLVFLFKKGLITIPTVDNANCLLSLNKIELAREQFIRTSYVNNKRDGKALWKPLGEYETESFTNPLTDYILKAINDGEWGSGPDNKRILPAAITGGLVTKYNELPPSDSVITVYISSEEAACTYGTYNGKDDGYETLFNRTDKVVALPAALSTHNIDSILNDFTDWVNANGYGEAAPISLLDPKRITSDNSSLYGMIENLANHVEGAALSQDKELSKHAKSFLFTDTPDPTITISEFIAVGDLLLMFFWLKGFILMPGHTRSLGLSAPIRKHVRGISNIFEDNRSLLINKYLEGKPSYINILDRGLFRAITASNPVESVNDIHEGQFELIFAYGYSQATSSTQSVFRKGIRGIVDCITQDQKKHRLNANRLNIQSIRKRLPSMSDDIWFPWHEAGLHLWHEWLHTLTNKTERLKGKTDRRHINRHFLTFLLEYSKATGAPVPESPFGITPRMIISEVDTQPDFRGYVQKLKLKTKSALFSAAKHIFDALEEHFPSQWSEAGFVHPFPKRLPFPSAKRNTTHRRPIESLHLDAIKDVLLCPDENGRPTFEWVKEVYSGVNNLEVQALHKRDVLFTDEGPVWWPGPAVCLAFLLEVPLRGIQARWLDEGCLDDDLFSLQTLEYSPNARKIHLTYPDGKRHADKHKCVNGRSGVIQQRPLSFIDSAGDACRGPALFINTNKTSVETGKFDQGYFIPWPNEEGMDLPYWLINYMMEFNQKYDPSPKPISFAYEGEMNRAESTRFTYSFSGDAEKLNQYPFVTPLFRDLTKDTRYTRNPNVVVFDKDGNEIVPPLTQVKIANLLNAVAVEAEKRLLAEGYPKSLASMTDKEGKVIYDIHTLRVTGVSRLMALGVPIEVIRDVVGHAVSVMTYYYSVLDQLEVMKKLREGLSVDINHFPAAELAKSTVGSTYFPNTNADPSATIQYGGWVERNGGICPSGVCEEGGPAIIDDDGNTTGFTTVPGGQYRCGNCRLWMSGPRYIPQQAHFIDLLMNEIVDIHEDRLRSYESKVEADTEIATLKRSGQEAPQSLLAKSSGLEAEVTQLTEKLSYLWMEWRNRYLMIEASIASLDNDKEKIDSGSLVLFTGQDPVNLDIQRHCGSKFGLKREIANSIVYHMPISHEVSNVLNSLERDMTKLQIFMSSNEGMPVSISQILDDDLRNRAIAMHAQHLYLIMQTESGDADQRIDSILSDMQKSLATLEDKERSALQQWHKAISESLKEMVELPANTYNTALIPLQTKLTDEADDDA